MSVRSILALCVSALALSASVPQVAGAAPTPAQALADLNAMRAEAGVPPVDSMRDDWNDGCAKHNRYEAQSGVLEHGEDHGSSLYTPEGEDAAQNSVLSTGESLPRDAWVDAVYHRSGLLQPRLRVSGFDASAGNTCLRIYGGIDDGVAARTPALALYPWPPEGATGQPTTFSGGESPSPEDEVGDSGLGLLLSVAVNGPWESFFSPRSDVVNASLTAADGSVVPVGISDRDSQFGSSYLGGGFGLFPLDPLEQGTRYTAHADGTVEADGVAYPFGLDWHFTTKAAPSGAGAQSLKLRSARVRAGRPLVVRYRAASSGRLSLRLTRAGRTYVSGSLHVRAGRGSASVPTRSAGRYLLRATLSTSKTTRLKRNVRVTRR